MRKSRSSTSIPVRVNRNIFETTVTTNNGSRDSSLERRRSRSVTRQKSSNLGLGLAMSKRNSSMERCTPLNHHSGSMNKYSYRRTPSSVTPSGSAYGSHLRATLYRQVETSTEKKISQKQLSNKDWIAQKFTTVMEFIQTSGLFEPQLASQIKPPSIRTMVVVFGTLFKEILPGANIDSHNYGDMVVQHLKLLRYPGNITVSAIKTANTSHGWPTFIAVTSWLVEMLTLASLNLNELGTHDEIEAVPQSSALREEIICILRTNYFEYTENQTVKANLQDLEKFKQNYANILGVDFEAHLKLSADIKSCEEKIAQAKVYRDKLLQMNSELEEENRYKQDIINQFEKSDDKKVKLELELEKARNRLQEAKVREKKLEGSKKQLSERIATQPHSVREKKKILAGIEICKRNKARRINNISEYQKIRDEIDMDYHDKISELEQQVDAWNVAITRTFLPEMQSLRLRDKGFHSHTFLQEIKETYQNKLKMEIMFEEETERLKVEIEELQRRRQELVESNQRAQSLVAKVQGLRKQIQTMEEDQVQILKETREATQKRKEEIERIAKEGDKKIAQEKQEVASCEKRKKELEEKFERTAMEGIGEAAQLYKYVAEKVLECQQALKNVFRMKSSQVEQYKTILRNKLEEVEKLKALVESFQQEWNKPLFRAEEDD